jgi:hypothetical protein
MQRLGVMHGVHARTTMERFLGGLERFLGPERFAPRIRVSPGTGAVALQMGGKQINIPLPTSQPGLYQRGGTFYSSGLLYTQGRKGPRLVDPVTALVQDVTASYQTGVAGAPTSITGVQPLRVKSTEAAAEYLEKVFGEFTRKRMQALTQPGGQIDFSRALTSQHRFGIRLGTYQVGGEPVNLQALYEQASEMQKRLAMMQGYGEISFGGGMLAKAKETREAFQQAAFRVARSEGLKAYTPAGQPISIKPEQITQLGVKEGGMFPFLRPSREGDMVYFSFQQPSQLTPLAGLSPGQAMKGYHQQAKIRLTSRAQLPGYTGPMAPIFGPTGYEDVMAQMQSMQRRYGRMGGRMAGETTGRFPARVAMLMEGQSDFARQYISEVLPDSQMLIAKGTPLEQYMRVGKDIRTIDVSAERAQLGGQLSKFLKRRGLHEGSYVDLQRYNLTGESLVQQMRVAVRGGEVEPVWAGGAFGPEREIIASPVRQRRGKLVRASEKWLARRRAKTGAKALIGMEEIPGVADPILHTIGVQDEILGARLKGGRIEFTIRQPRAGSGLAEGTVLGNRRVIVGGFGKFKNIAQAAVGAEHVKFGTDPAETMIAYLGDVFEKTARGKLPHAKARGATIALAKRLGLPTPPTSVGEPFIGATADEELARIVSKQLSGGREPSHMEALYQEYFGELFEYGRGRPMGPRGRIGPASPFDVQRARAATAQVHRLFTDVATEAGLTPGEAATFRQSFAPQWVPFHTYIDEALGYTDLQQKRQFLIQRLAGRAFAPGQKAKLTQQLADVTAQLRQVSPLYEKATEASRAGAGGFVFEGQGVQRRSLHPLEKLGPGALKYRLTELALLRQRAAGAPPEIRAAHQVIYESLRPKLAESYAGTDIYRILAQFADKSIPEEKLISVAPTYTLGPKDPMSVFNAFSDMPEVARGGPPQLSIEDLFANLQKTKKPTMLQESLTAAGVEDILGGKQNLVLRKGGFWLKLPEEVSIGMIDPVALAEGKLADAGVAKRVQKLYIPGLELYGKGEWDKSFNLFLQGKSTAAEYKVFGDHLNVIKAIEDLRQAPKAALKEKLGNLAEAYTGFLTAMGTKTPGKQSLLKRYLLGTGETQLMGMHIGLPGAAGPGTLGLEDALTVGVSPKWIEQHPAMRQVAQRLAAGERVPGQIAAYPAAGSPHQQFVSVRQLRPEELGDDIGAAVIATGEAIRKGQQRDTDFDMAALRIFSDASEGEAAKKIYSHELESYKAIQRAISRGEKFAPKSDIFSSAFDSKKLDRFGHDFSSAWESFTKKGHLFDDNMSAVLRQKAQTPMSYIVMNRQREALNMVLGLPGIKDSTDFINRVMPGDNRGSRAIHGLKRMVQDTPVGDRFGQAWTSALYSVMKKERGQEGLEQFAAVYKQFAKRDRAKGVQTLQTHLEQLYTLAEGTGSADLNAALDDIILKPDELQGNIAGGTYLREFIDEGRVQRNILQQMRQKKIIAGEGWSRWEGKALSEFMGDVAPEVGRAYVREGYFKPTADILAYLTDITEQLYQGTDEGKALAKSLRLFAGDTGPGRLGEATEGVLAHLMQIEGIPDIPLMVGDQAALHEVARQPGMQALAEAFQEQANISGKTPQGQPSFIKEATRVLRENFRAAWKTKAGKAGIVGVGALLAYELMGHIGGSDEPHPVYSGGGAPLPPRPLLDTAAQQMQQVSMRPPEIPVRVQRPIGMQDTAHVTARQHPSPMNMTMGYSSAVPQDPRVQHPELDAPQATSWEMQQYLGRKLRSSF